jgi:hypothetical protein
VQTSSPCALMVRVLALSGMWGDVAGWDRDHESGELPTTRIPGFERQLQPHQRSLCRGDGIRTRAMWGCGNGGPSGPALIYFTPWCYPRAAGASRGRLRGRARREETSLNWPLGGLLRLKEGHLDRFAASARIEAGTMTTVAGTYVKL